MVICLLLALLCLLPCTTALAAETGSENNTTTPTADDPYHKGESDDNSDADDLQWYRDNAALLENNNIVGNALRSVSWSITGLVCKVANIAETLYTKTFGLIDITNYPQINDLLDTLRPVLLALTVLCCAGLGIMLLVQHEKRPPPSEEYPAGHRGRQRLCMAILHRQRSGDRLPGRHPGRQGGEPIL